MCVCVGVGVGVGGWVCGCVGGGVWGVDEYKVGSDLCPSLIQTVITSGGLFILTGHSEL